MFLRNLFLCLLIAALFLATPSPAQEPPPAPAQASPLAAALSRLLFAGIPESGVGNFDQVRQEYAAAQKLAPTDPRVEACYGLALLHLQKNPAGLAALDKAAKSQEAVAPTAHRVLILRQLSQSKFADAAASLVHFAAALGAPQAATLPAEQKTEAARWIGRVAGFYLHPGQKQKTAGPIRAKQPAIEAALAADLKPHFAAGIQSIVDDEEELQQSVESKAEALGDEARRQRDAVLEKIYQGKDKSAADRGKLKLSAAQLDNEYQTAKGYIERQVAPLFAEYERTLVLYNEKVERLKKGPGGSFSWARIQEEKQGYGVRLGELETQLNAWRNAAYQVKSQYERVKGNNASKSRNLDELDQRLNRIKDNKKKEILPPERTAKTIASQRDKLHTYLPLDLRTQRNHLLKELSPVGQASSLPVP